MEEKKEAHVPIGEEREIANEELEVGLSWEMYGEKIDLDLTAVLLTDSGQLVDAVYFKKTKSDDEAIIHSGDERSGQKEGIDEKITINLNKLSPSTKIIAILINSASGQGFQKIETAELTLYTSKQRYLSFNCGIKGDFLSLYSALIYKKDDSSKWKIKNISETGSQKNFVECIPLICESLKFMIDDVMLKEVESWNLSTGKAFDLTKGNEIFIPDCLNEIAVGLGWETQCDLDSAVLLLDYNVVEKEYIYYGNKTSSTQAVLHQGDNLTGAGAGDDENIVIHLNKIPSNIKYLVCSINVFTGGMTFKNVSDAYCRLIEWNSKKEFCKYKLNESSHDKACILCYLRFDDNSKKWKIKALGHFLGSFNRNEICNIIKKDVSGGKYSGENQSNNTNPPPQNNQVIAPPPPNNQGIAPSNINKKDDDSCCILI